MKRFNTQSCYIVTHNEIGHKAYKLHTFYKVLRNKNKYLIVFTLNFQLKVLKDMGKPKTGLARRRKTQFKKGHTSIFKGVKLEREKCTKEKKVAYIRPSRSEYEAALAEPIALQALAEDDTPETDVEAGVNYRVLRPREDSKSHTAMADICSTADK